MIAGTAQAKPPSSALPKAGCFRYAGEWHGGEPTASGRAAQATARAVQPSEFDERFVKRNNASFLSCGLTPPLATALHLFLAFLPKVEGGSVPKSSNGDTCLELVFRLI